jgi:hypothetical protein
MSINQIRNHKLSSIMSINQLRDHNQLRNVVTDLNKTFERDNGRSASVSLEAAYTFESLKNEHPDSVEAKFLANMPDDQDRGVSINALLAAIMEDPENSFLLDQDPNDFEDRHEKNVSSFNREIELYESTLEHAAELRLNLPALEEENRQMRERFEASQADLQVYMANHRKTLARFELRQAEIEAAQAEFESSNESLGNYPKKVAE